MESLNKSLGKVSIGVLCESSVIMFVPVVQRLPVKGIITKEERSEAMTGKANQNLTVSHENTTTGSMSDPEILKAEIVFIKDSVEGGAGNMIPVETKLEPALDYMSLSQTFPSVSAQSENTPEHVAAGTASMETAVDKHRGISQWQCQGTSGRAEVSSGFFSNTASVSDDRMSDTHSVDLFPTPASSRESILSEGWEKEKSWSAASRCSSVRSGVFSPAVIQVKQHFLAPGSSLVNIPQTCFSSCESLSSSVCTQSPPRRHRPPLTRLSLLTAILRKGRLPVLSPSLQRPYTPCWPVNPVTLSFCNACSAASSVASIPLEYSSRFSSSASIDSQNHIHREPNRCITASPLVQPNEHSTTSPVTRCSEQIHSNSLQRVVISPPLAKSYILPKAPLPLFCSNSSLSHEKEKSDCASSKKVQCSHMSVSKPESPELKPSNSHMYLKGHMDNNFRKFMSPSPKPVNDHDTSVLQKGSRPQNSSLSKLHWLSQQLRSPSPCSPLLQPSQSRSLTPTLFPVHTDTTSNFPPSQKTTGRCESGGSHCNSQRSDKTSSQAFHKAHCLSPSRYTPIIFPGWPSPTTTPTPTSSPALPIRDFTPSPSLSLRSTPSPRPGSGISNYSDREGKKRKPHKIKLSYKSLAAIPTNTLLLDQQAIDEQVEREDSPCDLLDRGVDTHAEMCSPAQLRQQSEELYATIDEILANSIPACKSSPQTSRSSTPAGVQSHSSSPRSLGRETKYASLCSLQPSAGLDKKLMDHKKTKPGVIRPMTAIPRMTVEDEEEFHPNPFRQFVVKQTSTDNRKVENMNLQKTGKDCHTSSKVQMLKEERKPERQTTFSLCELQIIEPDDINSHPVKDVSTSFSPTEGRMEAFDIHI